MVSKALIQGELDDVDVGRGELRGCVPCGALEQRVADGAATAERHDDARHVLREGGLRRSWEDAAGGTSS